VASLLVVAIAGSDLVMAAPAGPVLDVADCAQRDPQRGPERAYDQAVGQSADLAGGSPRWARRGRRGARGSAAAGGAVAAAQTTWARMASVPRMGDQHRQNASSPLLPGRISRLCSGSACNASDHQPMTWEIDPPVDRRPAVRRGVIQ
jgi:hypothetical protein